MLYYNYHLMMLYTACDFWCSSAGAFPDRRKLSQAKFKVRNDAAATIYTKLYVHNMYTVIDIILCIVFKNLWNLYLCLFNSWISWKVKYYWIETLFRKGEWLLHKNLNQHRFIGPSLEISRYSKKRISVILWKKWIITIMMPQSIHEFIIY